MKFSLGSQREFSSASFYTFKNLLATCYVLVLCVGIMCRLALGMECCVVISGTQPYGAGILVMCSGGPNV